MNITIKTDSYNQRRYGRPWIAIINFTKSANGNFTWGDWAGDHYNGAKGVLSINANLGDIIAVGQKDFRKHADTKFSVVTAKGTLDLIGDKGAAYKHYLEHKTDTPDHDDLLIAAAQDLLEACKFAFENLSPKGNIKKDFSGHNAMATLSRAISKATEEV